MEVTTSQAGRAVGLTSQAVRDHINAGRLPATRVGVKGVYRILVNDLCRFAREYRYRLDESYLQELK